ncbi:MAG: D-alanine--D-alanine ligase A, partial [Lachnospiraceae bacterium]|nr:D-alanine--D-alanine ligase A [Lachnospiraceae bacterium]
MSKKNLAVIFGGRSSEHEVSCISVVTVAKAVDKEKYNVYLIGITKEGNWLKAENISAIEDGSWRESKIRAFISPDTKGELIIDENGQNTYVKLDAIFPVLHGMYGEDGTIQGLFEMADIPYVGCGVFASAASMDKFYTKVVVDTLDIRQAVYVPVLRDQLSDMDKVIARVEEKLSYPVFVKPSKAGSSKGVSKAENRDMLIEGLKEAAKHDYKILVEET